MGVKPKNVMIKHTINIELNSFRLDSKYGGGVPARFIKTTKEYADKCKENKLPYDMELYNKDMKKEILRVTHLMYDFFK